MQIMCQNHRNLVNSEYVDHFSVAEKTDATLIVAGLTNGTPVTMGRYKEAKEAEEAFLEMFSALVGGQQGFYMPESTLFCEQAQAKDSRVKRKGGS